MHQNYQKSNKEFIIKHIGRPIAHLTYCCLAAWGNLAWAEFHTNQSRPLIIQPQASNSARDSQPESYESYQLRILRNQNHLQAEKIKALREEMQEITQKLHDLKPHLFRQGDPADQLKIAQLTQLLGEKEETLNQLTQIKEQLDQDLKAAKKKLGEMEIVKEALASMVDSHRSQNERNGDDFRKKIEEMQVTTELEKNDLIRKIQQHEAIQEKLHQQLSGKGQTIQRLDDLATKMNTALAVKNDELLQLEGHLLSLYDLMAQISDHHTSITQGQEQQIQELVTALDFDQMHVDQLLSHKDESQWMFDVYHVMQDRLMSDILQLKDIVAAEQAKNEMLLQKHNQKENHLQQKSGYIQQLVLMIELEQLRSQKLEDQLLSLLQQQDTGQHHLDDMEAQLYEVNSRLTSKHDELNHVLSKYHMNLAALLAHLDSGETTQEQLNEEMSQLASKYDEHLATLLLHLGQADEENVYREIALENEANRHAQEVGTLFLHLDNESQASKHHLNNYQQLDELLNSIIADHKQKEDVLRHSLEESYEAYKQENHRMAQLEDLYEEAAHDLQLSHTNIISKAVIIAAQEQQLADRQARLAHETESLSQEAVYSLQLQHLLQDNLTELQLASDALFDHHEKMQDQAMEHQALEDDHAHLKEALANVENNLKKILADNQELAQENYLLQERASTQEFAHREFKEQNEKLNILLEQMRSDSEQAEQKLALLADLEQQLQKQNEVISERDMQIASISDSHELIQRDAQAAHLELHGQIQDLIAKLSSQEARNQALIYDVNYARKFTRVSVQI